MRKRSITVRLVMTVFCLLVVLAGCGGGGGGVSAGSGSGADKPTYGIGGRLQGLVSGNTVVLQNNGGDDLVLESDGEFTFATGLYDGDSYQVTVAGDAADCHCTVANGSGTVSAAAVDDVVVTCRHWTHPAGLDDNISPDGEDALVSQVAMAADGQAVITWVQNDGALVNPARQVFKSEYRDGAWIHPGNPADNISPNTKDAVVFAPVAMAAGGQTLICWCQYDAGDKLRIFMAEYRQGAWRYPTGLSDNINQAGMTVNDMPLAAMGSSGDGLIVWRQKDSDDNLQLFMAERRNGGWSFPSGLDDNISPNNQDVGDYYAAVNANGEALIVWCQKDGTLFNNYQVFVSRYYDGAWRHPAGLGDNISPANRNCMDPRVAINDKGEAVIVWRQQDSGGTYQIFKAEYRNGTWSYPADLDDNISPDGQDAEQPRVAMDDNGNAIIVWCQSDGGDNHIFMSEYRNGTWSHPSGLDDNISPDGPDAIAPQVAMDGKGEAIIAWCQKNGNGINQIFKSEYRNGAWSHPSGLDDNISPDGQDTVFPPQLAMDPNGNALITWTQSDGANLQIFKSEYR